MDGRGRTSSRGHIWRFILLQKPTKSYITRSYTLRNIYTRAARRTFIFIIYYPRFIAVRSFQRRDDRCKWYVVNRSRDNALLCAPRGRDAGVKKNNNKNAETRRARARAYFVLETQRSHKSEVGASAYVRHALLTASCQYALCATHHTTYVILLPSNNVSPPDRRSGSGPYNSAGVHNLMRTMRSSDFFFFFYYSRRRDSANERGMKAIFKRRKE